MTVSERSHWDDDRTKWRANPEVWQEANPAFEIRISADYMQKELASEMSDIDFERKYLGIWKHIGEGSLIPVSAWQFLASGRSQPSEDIVLTLDVPPLQEQTFIIMISIRGDGKTRLELVDTAGGLAWITPRLQQL